MYYIVRAAGKSSGEILHKPECTVSIETGGGMNPINFLKAPLRATKNQKRKPRSKDRKSRNYTVPIRRDTGRPPLVYGSSVPACSGQSPSADGSIPVTIGYSGLWAGVFLCHLSVSGFESIPIFGFGIADCGLREGGAAEAAPIFYGDFHRRVERTVENPPAFTSFRHPPNSWEGLNDSDLKGSRRY